MARLKPTTSRLEFRKRVRKSSLHATIGAPTKDGSTITKAHRDCRCLPGRTSPQRDAREERSPRRDPQHQTPLLHDRRYQVCLNILNRPLQHPQTDCRNVLSACGHNDIAASETGPCERATPDRLEIELDSPCHGLPTPLGPKLTSLIHVAPELELTVLVALLLELVLW